MCTSDRLLSKRRTTGVSPSRTGRHLVLVLSALASVLLLWQPDGAAARLATSKPVHDCNSHGLPRGCVPVPKGVRRPVEEHQRAGRCSPDTYRSRRWRRTWRRGGRGPGNSGGVGANPTRQRYLGLEVRAVRRGVLRHPIHLPLGSDRGTAPPAPHVLSGRRSRRRLDLLRARQLPMTATVTWVSRSAQAR